MYYSLIEWPITAEWIVQLTVTHLSHNAYLISVQTRETCGALRQIVAHLLTESTERSGGCWCGIFVSGHSNSISFKHIFFLIVHVVLHIFISFCLCFTFLHGICNLPSPIYNSIVQHIKQELTPCNTAIHFTMFMMPRYQRMIINVNRTTLNRPLGNIVSLLKT